jgi:hypothetical protein
MFKLDVMPFLLLLKNSTVIEPLSSIDMFIVECNTCSIVFVTVGALFVALCSSAGQEQLPGQRCALHNEKLMVCIPCIIKTVKSLHMQ